MAITPSPYPLTTPLTAVPTRVLIIREVPSTTLKLLFPKSAITNEPLVSMHKPVGVFRRALEAGPPSPVEPMSKYWVSTGLVLG